MVPWNMKLRQLSVSPNTEKDSAAHAKPDVDRMVARGKVIPVVQCQTAVTAHFSSETLLQFVFAPLSSAYFPQSVK